MTDPQDQQPPASGGTPFRVPSITEGSVSDLIRDPSTLAATGLLVAELLALLAGLIGSVVSSPSTGLRGHLLNLTDTVDVGDVAVLGIAVALLLLTPDPPGGVRRPVLLQISAVLAAVITVFGFIRALVLLSEDIDGALRISGFLATIGVAIAAATIAYYAATESFLKRQGKI